MKKVIVAVSVVVIGLSVFAKTQYEKVVIADTTKTIKCDTIVSVTYDTLKIAKAYKDTAIYQKSDTSRSKSKPVRIK
jgi:hypothetical protein